jgi:hypothetical protein
MTSGVYKLTFSSGREYIGKSVDIESRWKQHADKFRKGTAAKLMQQEYDDYGFPDANIIYPCHEDHLDIVEETLIWRNVPLLNGTKGRDRLSVTESNAEHLRDVNLYPLLHMSTLQHIAEIMRLRELVGE